MKTVLVAAAAMLTISTTNLHASTANLLAFGDSLLDSGNLNLALSATGGINTLPAPEGAPPRSYPAGQFTNGNVWTTQLGMKPSLAGGTNFGFGGATAVQNDDNIPDLKAQVRAFRKSGIKVDGNSTALLWAGGNDFRAFDDDMTERQVKRAVRKITRSIAKSVRKLYRSGVSNVIVFGLPEIEVLPESVRKYNEQLSEIMERLDTKLADSDIQFFDTNSLFQEILFTASQTRELSRFPCVYDPTGCALAPENYVLYDEIHPSEWVHSILADRISDQLGLTVDEEVTAVPLPATAPLLLGGLVGFGLWARRRKSRA